MRQSEQMAMWSMRNVVTAERSYQTEQGNFACTLAELGTPGKDPGGRKHAYLYDQQVVSGKKNGYNFTITDCDAAHYHAFAEPGDPGSGQRAFCTDQSGTLRASAHGKATTCLTSGEAVEDNSANLSVGGGLKSGVPSETTQSVQRLSIPQGVAQGLLVSRVQPEYPSVARQARIQGTIVLKAVISKTGDVDNLELVSGHPMLVPAAEEAVKQWKYRPYLLNGNAVAVETQITVNFALRGQ